MPKGSIEDIKPRNSVIQDTKPWNGAIEDIKPRNLELGKEVTRSYAVAHTVGVIMLTVPLITYSSAGTETQWSEGGGGVISI